MRCGISVTIGKDTPNKFNNMLFVQPGEGMSMSLREPVGLAQVIVLTLRPLDTNDN